MGVKHCHSYNHQLLAGAAGRERLGWKGGGGGGGRRRGKLNIS